MLDSLMINRLKKKFSVRSVFNLDMGYVMDSTGRRKLDAFGQPIVAEKWVTGFSTPTEFTPAIDPGYEFPKDETRALLMGMDLKDNILITGDTGTGKTSLVEQVAARLNYNVIKINFDGCVTKQDLIGEWTVKNKETVFQYGILVHAFKLPGTIILLDEWDTIGKDCSFVLQRPLERTDRRILIMEKGGELVSLHEDNLIIATANTLGQGDETGLYSTGTNVQNYAQINRFSMSIRMNYLDEQKELAMISKRFPLLEAAESKAFVKAIASLRDGYIHGDISVPLTHRDLINWVDKYLATGDYIWSARYCFLNRMSQQDALTAERVIERVVEAK